MKSRKRKGFTIVELIVVMAIIAVLTLIAVPLYSKYINSADEVDTIAIERAAYTAAVAYYTDERPEKFINPSQEDLAPYLDADGLGLEIVSGGTETENCNEFGHFKWGEYTGDKENKVCVHVVLEGKTYNGAGITSPATEKYIVVETYDPNAEPINEQSEPEVRYYINEF